jgi:hypothetical protein
VQKKLNTEKFLELLEGLDRGEWTASDHGKCIHLRRKGSDTLFSPLTAVYFCLERKEIHSGSFWSEELCQEFGFPWWEILEITYAEIACVSSAKRYDPHLRNAMLRALGLPEDELKSWHRIK